MENDKLEAKLQYKGNYVKDFKINILNKNIPKKRKLELGMQVGISNFITDKNGCKNARIAMINDIKVVSDKKELLDMHIEMIGMFTGSIGMDDNMLDHMLKFNGAPMLSQSIRAYITAITALSGIDSITLPLINFNEVFNESENNKK